MEKEFDVSVEYQKDRNGSDKDKYLWVRIFIMTIAAFLDWELFEWFYTILSQRH